MSRVGMAVAAPERSLDQRMEALKRANEIRSARAELKRDLKAGRRSIHELLLEPPEFVETAKVFDLLLAVPKYGRVKVNQALQRCRISPSKTVGGLSARQRTELVSRLRPGARDEMPGIQEYRQGPDALITPFEQSVLELAAKYGDVSCAYATDVAIDLRRPVNSVTGAANRLRQDGLLDQFYTPTEKGRRHLSATTTTSTS